MNKYLFLLLSLFVISCSQNESSDESNDATESTLDNSSGMSNKFADDSLRIIYTLQDERNTAALLPFLHSTDLTYQLAAIEAFASVQDSTALHELFMLLTVESTEIRAAAAYAIGQLGSSTASKLLREAIQQESSVPVKIKLLEALGKCATPKAVDFLATYYGNPELEYGVALGLFRALIKGETSEGGLARMVKLITPNSTDDTRVIASTYLARSRKENLLPFLTAISLTLRNDNNPHVRMNCARALAQTNAKEAADDLMKALANDENYLVQINALRAMRTLGDPSFKEAAYNALNNKNTHVGIVASKFILAHADKKDHKKLKKLLETDFNWRIKSNLLAAYAKLKAKNSKLIINRLKESTDLYEQGSLLMALSYDIEKYGIIKERLLHATSPVIKNYAMMALAKIRTDAQYQTLQKRHEHVDQEFIDIIKHCMASQDIALIYHSALLLRNPKINFKSQLGSLDFIEEALQALALPQDIEAYQELIKTLDYLKGNPTPSPIPAYETTKAIDWDLVSKIAPDQLIKIHTTKGAITLKLMVEAAPGTVSEVMNLVQKRFYDGKTFHRVVPNFVAQGGCPRGDGFGGLAYTIRSEFPALYYQEGYVGMASAGKDTEGCQWFITHSPTPHLDGRYTIFAKVISGMPIVHRLLVGDSIERIEIMKSNIGS